MNLCFIDITTSIYLTFIYNIHDLQEGSVSDIQIVITPPCVKENSTLYLIIIFAADCEDQYNTGIKSVIK